MSTDIERYEPQAEIATVDPTGGRLVSWAHAMHAAKQLADALSNTTFVPAVFRGKPDDAAAAIMYGDEVGFTPGQALQNIYVISGKPGLYARSMVALVLSRGHEIWTEASSPQRVIVCGKRRGTTHVERVEWTRAKAETAGYTSNKKYTTDPESMLYARASGDVARRIAPDALAGIAYTVEELELNGETPAVTVTRADTPKRTAKRAAAKPAPEAEEPELDDKPPAEPTYDTGGITDAQRKKIGALMREADITDRSAALLYVGDVIGREISSRNDLTKDEASRVIDALEAEKGNAGSAEQFVDAFPDETAKEET